jgi:hypothetical protein
VKSKVLLLLGDGGSGVNEKRATFGWYFAETGQFLTDMPICLAYSLGVRRFRSPRCLPFAES